MSGPSGAGLWLSFNGPATTGVAPAAIMERAQAYGVAWLAVKAGSGSESTRWLAHGAEFIACARRAGIGLYTWHYSYPGSWPSEADMIARLISQGVDGHVIDAELEWEWVPGAQGFSPIDRRPAAAAFMAAVRARVPDAFIAHAPIWRPQSHPTFPYVEFNERCDAVMPQMYWTAANQSAMSFCARADDVWRTWAAEHTTAVRPIMPIGITYGAGDGWDDYPYRLTAEDVTAFINRYPTCSLFSWDAANARAWSALMMRRPTQPADAPTTPGDLGPVAADPDEDVNE